VLPDELCGGDRRHRTPPADARTPASRRFLEAHRRQSGLPGRLAAPDNARPDGEAHGTAVRGPVADQPGMLLGSGLCGDPRTGPESSSDLLARGPGGPGLSRLCPGDLARRADAAAL